MPFISSYTTSYYSQRSTGDWNPSQGFRTDSGTMNPTLWIDIHDGQNYVWDSANTDITSITDKSGNGTITLQNFTPPDGLTRGTVALTSSGPFVTGENEYEFIRMNFFNQDLSGWCVTNITTEPNNFSYNSNLASSNHPVWGTCP